MKVLGISDGMTGGAALIEDRRILYAVHEERLIREKMATGFPRESINKVLEDTHTKPEEIDAIAVATVNEFFREKAVVYDGWLLREQAPMKELLLNVSSMVNRIFGAQPFLQRSYYDLKVFLGRSRRRAIEQVLRHDWEFTCPIRFIDHHFAHACSTYFTSGLNDATVITMDGAGDNSSSKVYLVKDGNFQQFWNIDSFNSLGNYYAYITHICGFKAQKHEGKITGLAAYGKPEYVDVLRRFVGYEDGRTINRGQVFYWAAVKAIEKALPKSFRREDLATSMQQVFEDVACSYIKHWVEKTGCEDVALSGGVFANVKLNQRIHELLNVNSVFIHPGMGDEGLPVGAAFALSTLLSSEKGRKVNSIKLDDVYFGPNYSEKEIEEAIAKEGLKAEYVQDIERGIAELLAQGRVVARFDGRMEYGPRALGNRTILYQPTDPTVNDWLNKNLKRTEFMPFAPVTLKEFEDQCYVNMEGARYPAKFMTITFDCTPWMKKTCPAVVHVDGTARPQIIERDVNPSYYKIVDEYRKITGIPTLINTSFNMHEEPIVCSPTDAIRSFCQGNLDYLAIGNFLLKNQK
ncbi:MAG: carbamoyltransferase C-terminal domain-containing protein [Nitrospirota bacterium]